MFVESRCVFDISIKVKVQVKGGGQECPRHIFSSHMEIVALLH